jgi:hypothetical protein
MFEDRMLHRFNMIAIRITRCNHQFMMTYNLVRERGFLIKRDYMTLFKSTLINLSKHIPLKTVMLASDTGLFGMMHLRQKF